MNFGKLKMYIDGRLVNSVNDMTKNIVSPLNEAKIANLSWGSAKDSIRALESAEKGFRLWSNTSIKKRREWMLLFRSKILDNEDILPVEENDDVKRQGYAVKWAFDEDGKPIPMAVDLTAENLATLDASMDESRFSYSVEEGELGGQTGVGIDHPSNLGDGTLDFIPETVRSWVWAPLGMTVFFQFLLLGVFAGALLGGSQGLARSMFGQMVPETRSAEFFGFFGFFGKVAALLGPLIYSLMTVWFDSRVGIFALSTLIIAGVIILRKVDVEDGIAVAKAEDERNRSASSE